MPSTLYQSVKDSVIKFADLRKKNQKLEDKLIFRWKLITLGLSIVFIILVGAFSQILKAINTLPTLINDKSFILTLVDKVSDQSVPTVLEANNLITGISGSLEGNVDTYNFIDAAPLFDYPGNPGDIIDIPTIVSKISSYGRLVFVISSNQNPALSKFAFFGYGAYSYPPTATTANVYDQDQSKYSTFFNLGVTNQIYQYTSSCPIYRRNDTTLVLFESFAIKSDGTAQIGFQSTNYGCLSATDLAAANLNIEKWTSVNLAGGAKPFAIGSLQIFSLSLA